MYLSIIIPAYNEGKRIAPTMKKIKRYLKKKKWKYEIIVVDDGSSDDTIKVVKKENGCIVWGGAVDLAAADDKLIRIRHPLSLDPEGMLLSSILAKKAAVNATHVLIDVPLGKDTKIKTKKQVY